MKMRKSKLLKTLGAVVLAAAVCATAVIVPISDDAKVYAATTRTASGTFVDGDIATTTVKIDDGDTIRVSITHNGLLPQLLDGFNIAKEAVTCDDVDFTGFGISNGNTESFDITNVSGEGRITVFFRQEGADHSMVIIVEKNSTTPDPDPAPDPDPVIDPKKDPNPDPANPDDRKGGNDSKNPGKETTADPDDWWTAGPHNHDDSNLEWTTLTEASETEGGYAELRCKKCGEVIEKKWVNAYYIYNINTVKKIEKAPLGGTVLAETDRWVSFHKMVFDALAARPDVTLNVNYVYDHQKYTMTIPAGKSGLPGVLDENGYAGYRRICTIYPTVSRQ